MMNFVERHYVMGRIETNLKKIEIVTDGAPFMTFSESVTKNPSRINRFLVVIMQYPISYANWGAPQRLIIVSNDQVKQSASTDIKTCDGSNKQRWCPSGLSRTQKRKLQQLRKQRSLERQPEEKPISTRIKEWKPKQVSSASS